MIGQWGFVNLYQSGFYHRAGKPGCFDMHPGDVYASEEAAQADIDSRAKYITTVPILLPRCCGNVNPHDSAARWSK